MAIQVVRYLHDDEPEWGVVHGRQIAALRGHYPGTADFIEKGMDAAQVSSPADATIALDAVELLSPVTDDRQFICQGINYASHVRESGMDPEKIGFNTIFTKAPSCLVSARSDVIRPGHVQLLDYEIELGLVLRQPISHGTKIEPDHLHKWLAGVTIVNDVSARDVQLPQGQFYKGKSYRTFGPTGPFLVLLSPAEWRRWPELRMRLQVNGQQRQDAYCGEMLFAPHHTLTELSLMQDLRPGDLIATGTPAGCAARAPGKPIMWAMKHLMSEKEKWKLFIGNGANNARYLTPGDTMQASIRTDDGAIDLGVQCNRIVAG